MSFTPGRIVLASVVIAVLIVTGLTIASAQKSDSNPAQALKTTPLPTKVAPDVVGQPYVFAESVLQEHGFGWKVVGPVAGWAEATVASQTPLAGTTVVDTGAPCVTLQLSKPKSAAQHGTPENSSPYTATPIMLPPGTASSVTTAANAPATTGTTGTTGQTTTPTSATPGATVAKPVVKPKPVAKPKPSQASKRPPAFKIAGARSEPLDEIPLPERAKNLSTWLDSHRQASAANERYWLYQQAWIVTGARFGWWHGAQALETLIAVDKRVEALWGIGSRSEAEARAALQFVRAHGG